MNTSVLPYDIKPMCNIVRVDVQWFKVCMQLSQTFMYKEARKLCIIRMDLLHFVYLLKHSLNHDLFCQQLQLYMKSSMLK